MDITTARFEALKAAYGNEINKCVELQAQNFILTSQIEELQKELKTLKEKE